MIMKSLHEDVEWEMKRIEIGDESTNGGKGAEIEMHNDDIGIRKLGEDTSLCFLCCFHTPSREDKPRSTLSQNTRRLRSYPRRSTFIVWSETD